jgi:branched-subunit amino acid aminotransferase/4-amino-4-deoxychorismate lyase
LHARGATARLARPAPGDQPLLCLRAALRLDRAAREAKTGIDLHVSSRLRIAPESVDPTIKNYHWIDLVLSLFDAYDRGADTSCVVDANGNVAEGPGFNVFMVEAAASARPSAASSKASRGAR